LPTLQRALSDPLGGLIDSYGKAVRENPKATISNLEELIDHLQKASIIRNVPCHGSWNRRPDEQGRSLPQFITKTTIFLRPQLIWRFWSKCNDTRPSLLAPWLTRLRIWDFSSLDQTGRETRRRLKNGARRRLKLAGQVATVF
jgi:hypothetical protein